MAAMRPAGVVPILIGAVVLAASGPLAGLFAAQADGSGIPGTGGRGYRVYARVIVLLVGLGLVVIGLLLLTGAL